MKSEKNKERSIFSINLIKFRKKRGLSQYDLSDLTGISQRMIAHYETHSILPPIEKAEAIASALKVKLSDLFSNDKPKNTEIDISQFDVRSLRKLQDLLSLPSNDRSIIYRMLNKLLRENQTR